MDKHTPGPWWWEDWDTDGGARTRSLVAKPETRSDFPNRMFPDLPNRILCDENNECTPADKALIAAAPDLLKELEVAVAWIEDAERSDPSMPTSGEILPQLRAAIAKAQPDS